MSVVPEEYADLFDKPSYGIVGTVMPSGHPHVTPVWIDADEERVLVNTAKGRRKERNVRRDPRVGVTAIDSEDFYRYVAAYGEVTNFRESGAEEHIHALSRRYTGEDYPYLDGDEERVILEIEPEHVFGSG